MFAEERIPARRFVIEYVCKSVNPVEAYRWPKSTPQTYAFALAKFWRTDRAVAGTGVEFINHSCDPNLLTRILGDRILYQS